MTALDPFALGGYQQPDRFALTPTLSELWREHDQVTARLEAIEEPGEEEDRLAARQCAIEHEIAGRITSDPADLLAKMRLLTDYLDGCVFDGFVESIAGTINVGLLTLAMDRPVKAVREIC